MSNPYQQSNPQYAQQNQQQYPQQYPQQYSQQYSQQQQPYPQQQQQQYPPQQQYYQSQQPNYQYQQVQQPVQQQPYYQQTQPQHNVVIDEQQKNPLDDYDLGESFLSNVGFDQRKKFIVKVYSLLTIQLFVTFVMVAIACFSKAFRDLLINPYSYKATPFYWSMFAVSFVTEIAIFCFKKVARKVPNNYIALTIFTVSFSFVVAGSCAVCKDAFENGGTLILIAALMTFAVTASLTVYACRTKSDFTMAGGALFILSSIMFILFIFAIFFFNIILWLLLCSLSVILYGFYLIYDTQLIIGGKSHQLSIDDYVIGTMFIYIDIIILFLRILQILMILFGKK
ncbi:unnamed protein product (macronuclear) [Paramecium tetraurelia]|uniref:Inhibitor of apoptosis-promoting Bax1 protein n=1 Tax=Paramecium tetraurelia TaxID=5888 RepID=A0CCK0_PARTE|nr:uncharacterized protein GSPATT00037302001 [Paramecium tetraurelia]CAK68517.1 unnamed protein product [Paramecium tetraurelia]|eukprot:XP_001435914.1 hypothetical protein (macronuclear) [Paramecium tetraurelia strain d4-2]